MRYFLMTVYRTLGTLLIAGLWVFTFWFCAKQIAEYKNNQRIESQNHTRQTIAKRESIQREKVMTKKQKSQIIDCTNK
jgi:hypothetical protein